MILLINGPFGMGKSSAAQIVAQRLPGHLFDPEEIGALLGTIGVHHGDDDFRDLAVWRELTVATTASVLRHVAPDVVIPMNLLRAEVHDELIAQWSKLGRVVEVRLTATAETLRSRIMGRADIDGPEWCLAHLDADLGSVRDPRYGVEVDTNSLSVEQVADQIIEAAARRVTR